MPNEQDNGLGYMLGDIVTLGALSGYNDWRQNKNRKELAQYEFRMNRKMWDLQNAYNSPQQQMMRLRAAGLNPNLVYGNGAVGNTSGPAPRYEAPDYEASFAMPSPLETISKYQNNKLQIEAEKTAMMNRAKTKSEITRNNAETAGVLVRNGILKSDARIRKVAANFAQELTQTQLDANRQNLTNSQKQELLLDLERDIKDFERKLNDQGFTRNDPYYVRAIAQAMEAQGITPEDILKKFMENQTIESWLYKQARDAGKSAYEWLFGFDPEATDIMGRPLNRNQGTIKQ